jgi:phosphonate transport system substrate-binding protein
VVTLAWRSAIDRARRATRCLAPLLAAVILAGPAGARAEGDIYTFGVVPQQAASDLAESWAPLLAWLSARTQVNLRFATAPDIPTFEARLARGDYHLAYMNPYHYTVFHRKAGYQALAKERDRKLQGILVVRKDSPARDIRDLAGATLVFPAPAAFAASILPRAALRKEGVAFASKFVSSHDSVYMTVARGLYPAGGGIIRTLELFDPMERNALRVLWTTPAYTPHAIAAHPGLPRQAAARLRDAMVAMADDPVGRGLLARLGFKGIEAADDADWDDIRRLHITDLDAPGP